MSDDRPIGPRAGGLDRRRFLHAVAATGLAGAATSGGAASAPAPESYADRLQEMAGEGTEDDPYLVAGVEDLQAMAEDPGAHYALDGDVDASATADWNDGAGFDPVEEFTGTLDGRGNAIRGLTIDRSDEDGVGLLAYTDGTVRDLSLVDVAVRGNVSVGALAGYAAAATVEAVDVSGSVDGTESVGGLVGGVVGKTGVPAGATVEECAVDCEVSGDENVGGLAGEARGSTAAPAEVSGCVAAGRVTGAGAVGGLVGDADTSFDDPRGVVLEECRASATVAAADDPGGEFGGLVGGLEDATVTESLATGDVDAAGAGAVGGLVGEVRDPDAVLEASYATGSVEGYGAAGGLAGYVVYGEVRQCYATGDVTGHAGLGGVAGEVREATVADAYATGDVTARSTECEGVDDVEECDGPVGGVVGSLENTFGGATVVERTLATGAVDGPVVSGAGGVVGAKEEDTTVDASYWDAETTGRDAGVGTAPESSDTLPAENGVETADLQGEAAAETCSEFDFERVWRTVDDDYPDLRIESGAAENTGTVPVGQFDVGPYPVTTGDRPVVEVVLQEAEAATLVARYEDADGDPVEVERDLHEREAVDGGTVWTTREELPAVDRVGTWVDLTVEVERFGRTDAVEDLEGRLLDESTALGYYVFDHVMDAVVLPARFPGEDPPTGTDPETLDRWLRARELDANRLFGSGRGAMGAVGFSFTLVQDGRDFFEVDRPREEYEGLVPETGVDPVDGQVEAAIVGEFFSDLLDAASEVDPGDYDFVIGTHAGETITRSEAAGAVLENSGRMYAPHLLEDDVEDPTWPHELGHRYGFAHVYDRGIDNALCAMGNATRTAEDVPSVAPFSTPLRIADSLGLTFGDFGTDGFRDWLSPDPTPVGDLDGDAFEVPALQRYDLGDAVPVVEADGLAPGDVTFLAEARPFVRADPTYENLAHLDLQWDREFGAAVIYRRERPVGGTGSLQVVQHADDETSYGVLVEPGDGVTDRTGLSSPATVTFELEAIADRTAPPEEFRARVSVETGTDDPNTRTVAVRGRVEAPEVGAGESGSAITPPSLDLRARDAGGRVVGVDGDHYAVEIPDARASGKRVRGTEWISVPSDADVEFTVDATDVERFVEDLAAAGYLAEDEGDDRPTVEAFREDLTVEAEVAETRYGDDPEATTRNGRAWVDGATVRTDRFEVAPGEAAAAEPSTGDGALGAVGVAGPGSLEEEAITLVNEGSEPLDLEGWTLRTDAGATYAFPAGTVLDPGADLVLYARSGEGGDGVLYWGATDAVLSPDGGRITVTDGDGTTRLDVGYDEFGVVHYDDPPSRDADAGTDDSTATSGGEGFDLGDLAVVGGLLGGGYLLTRETDDD